MQFSLKVMLFVVTVFGLVIAPFAAKIAKQRRLAQEQAFVNKWVAAVGYKNDNVVSLSIASGSLKPSSRQFLGISRLTSLNTLGLNGNPVTDVHIKEVGKLKGLRRLWLSRTNVTERGLSHLTGLKHLEELNLMEVKLTDAAVRHLKRHSKLRWLNVHGTDISDTGLRDLSIALPNCRIMH